MRGATQYFLFYIFFLYISTHAPHARCDKGKEYKNSIYWRFQLTHLMRGATFADGGRKKSKVISTHAPHARCDKITKPEDLKIPISTHAPHARCDFV